MADDDVGAFMPAPGQAQYAFPAGQPDDQDASEQRNQQVQSAFDSQRFQRDFISGIAKSMASQGAEINRLRQANQQKSSS